MIADRLIAWLGEAIGYQPTRWSLARIAAISAVALALAPVVVPSRPADTRDAPYNRGLATPAARNVTLPLGDTRGFGPTPRPKAFRIAWVGGSEVLGVGAKHRAFIPAVVTDQIGSVDDKLVSTDIYFLNAIRLVDELTAMTAAVATKPDLVVVSLNPFWVLNDLAVQQWGYLDGVLALHLRGSPTAWPVAASLVSPGDAGWKLLSVLSDAVNERFDWGVDLTERTSDLSFLDQVENAEPASPTPLARLAERRPVDFFFARDIASEGGVDLTATQLRLLKREIDSTSSFNQTVLSQMVGIARRSGIDTYFYMPPIAPDAYRLPAAKEYLDVLRDRLAAATGDQTGAHVVFDPQGLQDRVPTTAYEDTIHVLDPRPEARVLTADLCALLVTWGRQPECEGS